MRKLQTVQSGFLFKIKDKLGNKMLQVVRRFFLVISQSVYLLSEISNNLPTLLDN